MTNDVKITSVRTRADTLEQLIVKIDDHRMDINLF